MSQHTDDEDLYSELSDQSPLQPSSEIDPSTLSSPLTLEEETDRDHVLSDNQTNIQQHISPLPSSPPASSVFSLASTERETEKDHVLSDNQTNIQQHVSPQEPNHPENTEMDPVVPETETEEEEERISVQRSLVYFNGSTVEAIQQTRTQNKLFAVFLSDGSAESLNFEKAILLNETISEQIRANSVFLNLKWDSLDGKNFLAIYPALRLPTVYFIGLGGQPLSILIPPPPPTSLSSLAEDFERKFQTAIQLYSQQLAAVVIPSSTPPPHTPPSFTSQTTTSSSSQSPTSPTSHTPTPHTPTPHTASPITQPSASQRPSSLPSYTSPIPSSPSHPSTSTPTPSLSSSTTTTTTTSSSSPTPTSPKKSKGSSGGGETENMREIKREKNRELKEKERIREQIRLDRLEREAQRHNNLNPTTTPVSAPPTLPSTSTVPSDSGTAALSIRLLDGSLVKLNFSSSQTLADVATSLQNSFGYNRRYVRFLCVFPRQEFDQSHMSKSLLSLSLSPSASLIVLWDSAGGAPPATNRSVSSSSGSSTFIPNNSYNTGSSLTNTIYSVSSTLYDWTWWLVGSASTFIWPPAPATSPDPRSSNPPSSSPTPNPRIPPRSGGAFAAGSPSTSSSPGSSSSSGPTIQRRNVRSGNNENARFGTLGSLRTDNERQPPKTNGSGEDDDNLYWNGNSTQQQ